ncbi:MAG: glutathione peroxidase [Ideonella sp.]|jgi:glutathione peroxidase|nr:glutathione peroxidase [Ideonella sp.]MBL0150156.1 glutathione peroxidase [Ideonella sp.]
MAATAVLMRLQALALVLSWPMQGASAQGAAPAVSVTGAAQVAACPALLHQRFPRLQDEKPQDLCQYAGKVLLVVNTASYCGFTSQYEGLEALHAKYASKGLVVLGFPSNDFGQQEPGDSKQIADFCFNTYAVKFPMFAKTSVVGPQANPLHTALAKATGKAPKWNFHKYLIDAKGQAVASYVSATKPSDAVLVDAIEKALASR